MADYWSFLFIGGHHDGKRVEVPDLPKIVLPVPRRDVAVIEKPVEEIEPLECQIYRREHLRTENTLFTFYVLDRLSLEEALWQLFKKYGKGS